MFKKSKELKELRGLAEARAIALKNVEDRLLEEMDRVRYRDEYITHKEKYIADLRNKIIDLENNIEFLVANCRNSKIKELNK